MSSQNIAKNLAQVMARLEAAAQQAGRPASEITLVAVTKTHPLETVIEAYQAGLRHFGENRSEEGQQKIEAFAAWLAQQPNAEPVQWHFIGHVQSRQAGDVLASGYHMLHSLDSVKLAKRLNRLAERDDQPPVNVLLQCNVSGEESKYGFELNNWQQDSAELETFLNQIEQIAALKKVNIQGLMTMAPWLDDPAGTRPTFAGLATLRQTLRRERPELAWPHLSMGMTDDFEVAIEEGATLIRVGRAIFGERDD